MRQVTAKSFSTSPLDVTGLVRTMMQNAPLAFVQTMSAWPAPGVYSYFQPSGTAKERLSIFCTWANEAKVSMKSRAAARIGRHMSAPQTAVAQFRQFLRAPLQPRHAV